MKNKTNNNFEILRWIALVPAVCFAWYISSMFFAWVGNFFYNTTLWNSYGNIFAILGLLILPAVAVFFVARGIAPKHKRYIGYISIILSILWSVLMFYGLFHMAY